MNQPEPPACAVVTFAVYDEAPIACQGDDDQRKIRIVTLRLCAAEVHWRAACCAIAMMEESGAYVQVWQVTGEAAQSAVRLTDKLTHAMV